MKAELAWQRKDIWKPVGLTSTEESNLGRSHGITIVYPARILYHNSQNLEIDLH